MMDCKGCLDKQTIIDHLTERENYYTQYVDAASKLGLLIDLCGKDISGKDRSYEDAEVIIRNAIKMMTAQLEKKPTPVGEADKE